MVNKIILTTLLSLANISGSSYFMRKYIIFKSYVESKE